MRYLFFLLLIGCKSPEIPEPVNVMTLRKSYTFQVQPTGITSYPKYLPNLK